MASCNHLILHCMDYRLQSPLRDWIVEKGWVDNTDRVSIAGSCKDPDLAIENIKVGCDLHGVGEVILTQHDDCGAYGGHAAFESLEQERAALIADMDVLRDRVLKRWPDVRVTRVYIEQDGDGWKFVEI
ncbi:MAG: hypothetical protein KKA42_14815 [candidate division Zixibacteria bacterium]|nr:hypothetical protein [candidate division Zixibacteria bacterium]